MCGTHLHHSQQVFGAIHIHYAEGKTHTLLKGVGGGEDSGSGGGSNGLEGHTILLYF
jgi:hypothetical protein